MVSITLSVSKEVKEKMERFPEINWSGLLRKQIEKETERLVWREEMLKKLKVEEEISNWAIDVLKKSRKGRFEELKKKGLV